VLNGISAVDQQVSAGLGVEPIDLDLGCGRFLNVQRAGVADALLTRVTLRQNKLNLFPAPLFPMLEGGEMNRIEPETISTCRI
jgi:hypothetical protein